MALPETDVARVRRWVGERNARLPERAMGLIRYEMDVDPRAITILECRPPWREGYGTGWTRRPIARLRYTKVRREWQIYWPDRNLEFHAYNLVDPTQNIEALLSDIDDDPTGIFWG